MKKGLLLFFALALLCVMTNAQSSEPEFIIDFDADIPEVTHVSPTVVEVTGNVLRMKNSSANNGNGNNGNSGNEGKEGEGSTEDSFEEAGFGYKITMTVSGGPASLAATPIDFDYTLLTDEGVHAPVEGYKLQAAPSEFKGARIGTEEDGYFQTLLTYDLKGWVKDDDNFTYYRDPSTKMRFELELDNGADLVNVAYSLGDMDYNFVGTKSTSVACPKGVATDQENYTCRESYIDQITFVSGAGSNEYTYDESKIVEKDNVLYAKFLDANDDQLIDAEDDGRVSFRDTDGNITIYNRGNIGKKIIFEYDDAGFPTEAEQNNANAGRGSSSRNGNYHDFDAKNQVMYFLSGMTFSMPGDITGCIVEDTNGNGIVDPTETTKLEGVIVSLCTASGTPIASAPTGPSGQYFFLGLPPGDYRVKIAAPDGYKLPGGVSALGDLVASNGTSDLISLAGGTIENHTIGMCPCQPIIPSATETDIYQQEEFCITIDGPGDYLFSPATDVTLRGTQVCFSPLETTTYTITSSKRNCDYDAQVEVRVWQESAVPTMSEWGLMIFGLLILNLSVVFLYRREEFYGLN